MQVVWVFAFFFFSLSLCHIYSPDVILCGWLGLKHQLTNSHIEAVLSVLDISTTREVGYPEAVIDVQGSESDQLLIEGRVECKFWHTVKIFKDFLRLKKKNYVHSHFSFFRF